MPDGHRVPVAQRRYAEGNRQARVLREIVVGMLYLPIRPARWEESGTWGVWVYARSESEKAGEVKYMRTGKAEWARGTKGKTERNSCRESRDTLSSL
jgi:hypothetical protein